MDLPAHSQENGDIAGMDRIPVVDLEVLVNGNADQRSQAIQHLGRACQEWGCFMVINHGVPESLQRAIMDTCQEMFNLPAVENAQYMDAGPMAPVSLGTSPHNRKFIRFCTHPDFHCSEKPANLRGNLNEYSTHMRGLVLELTTAISQSLGLDDGRIVVALNLHDCYQVFGWNQYPDPPADGIIGFPPHSDHGILSVLFQNDVDGIQVQKDDRWILAKPIPNSVFIIAGDQLEILSNGRYKAAPHRVIVHGEHARISSGSLIGPCLNTVVQPIPELAPEGVEFMGIKYRDYMEYKYRGIKEGNTGLVILPLKRDAPGVAQTNSLFRSKS